MNRSLFNTEGPDDPKARQHCTSGTTIATDGSSPSANPGDPGEVLDRGNRLPEFGCRVSTGEPEAVRCKEYSGVFLITALNLNGCRTGL